MSSRRAAITLYLSIDRLKIVYLELLDLNRLKLPNNFQEQLVFIDHV